ncbi:hypothetical protein FI667_g16388, partial [Globisporangium splendens]
MIKREEIKIVNGFVVMTVKRHKTYHFYGPVVVVLPPRFTSDFEVYLQHRDNLARSGCSSLFIDRRGEQEPYLTKRFQKLVYMKFGKVVSIRDCRSIYVTKASKELNMQQLYSLSRQMYHSFQTQQTIYCADDSVQRAMESGVGVEADPRVCPRARQQDRVIGRVGAIATAVAGGADQQQSGRDDAKRVKKLDSTGVNEQEQAWRNRENPRVHKVFATIMQIQRLWVSVDCYGVVRLVGLRRLEISEQEYVAQILGDWQNWDFCLVYNPTSAAGTLM